MQIGLTSTQKQQIGAHWWSLCPVSEVSPSAAERSRRPMETTTRVAGADDSPDPAPATEHALHGVPPERRESAGPYSDRFHTRIA